MGNLLSSFSSESAASSLIDVGNDANDKVDMNARGPELLKQPYNVLAYDSPRFEADDKELLSYLEEYGYVIVKNILSKEEVHNSKHLLWNFLEKHFDMDRNDPKTWTDTNFAKFGRCEKGIMHSQGINQSEYMWSLRGSKKIKDIFSKIYDDNDLITSFDGGNIFRPWHNSSIPDGEFMKTNTGWFHVDQGKTLRGRVCVQGLVTLTDVNETTGGFCVIPKSQIYHDELVDRHALGTTNFVKCPPDYHVLQQQQILPKCRAGDMVLWDSRTIHANTPTLPDAIPSEEMENELLRIVGYICMTPTHLANKEMLINRINIYERGLGTTHWPHNIAYNVANDDERAIKYPFCECETWQKQLIAGNNYQNLR